MKTHFTFTVLRYIHDPVSGEFANVGVVLYAPELRFLDAICTPTYGRISAYFADFNPDHFKRMMKHIERRVWDLSQTLGQLPFENQPKTAQDCAARVLPPDDSSLQFSPIVGSGVTSDPGCLPGWGVEWQPVWPGLDDRRSNRAAVRGTWPGTSGLFTERPEPRAGNLPCLASAAGRSSSPLGPGNGRNRGGVQPAGAHCVCHRRQRRS